MDEFSRNLERTDVLKMWRKYFLSEISLDRNFKRNILLNLLYSALLTSILLGIFIYTDFALGSNDFLGNYFLSISMNIKNPESWYNGFFPVGYTLLLKLFSFINPRVLGALINCLSVFFVLFVCGLFITTISTFAVTFPSLLLLFFYPKIFKWNVFFGPDSPVNSWAIFMAVCFSIPLLSAEIDSKQGNRFWILGGIAGGMAGLCRTHGLLLCFLLLMSFALISEASFKRWTSALIVLIGVYSIQLAVNLISGHGIFETSQSFNVYKTVYEIDWYHIDVNAIPLTITGVIKLSVPEFIKMYFREFRKFLPLIMFVLIIPFTAVQKKLFQISLAVSIALMLYISVVLIGGSEHADIPVKVFLIFQGALACSAIYHVLKRMNKKLLLPFMSFIFILLGLYLALISADLFKMIHDLKFRGQLNAKVQEYLVSNESLKDATQLFCTDAYFYLPDVYPYMPNTLAGWGRFHVYGFNEMYPELSFGNQSDFAADCRKAGISLLLLDKQNAFHFSEALAELCGQEKSTPDFRYVKCIGPYHIFRVRPAPVTEE